MLDFCLLVHAAAADENSAERPVEPFVWDLGHIAEVEDFQLQKEVSS